MLVSLITVSISIPMALLLFLLVVCLMCFLSAVAAEGVQVQLAVIRGTQVAVVVLVAFSQEPFTWLLEHIPLMLVLVEPLVRLLGMLGQAVLLLPLREFLALLLAVVVRVVGRLVLVVLLLVVRSARLFQQR
jgi:hypothetical protein